jgi:hypothetical protein
MAITYTLIASYTVGSGGVAYVEFTSIPNTYTNLVLRSSSRDTSTIAANDGTLTVNGSNANFSRTYYSTAPNGNTSDNQANNNIIYSNTSTNTASFFSNQEIMISDYAKNHFKSFSADIVTTNESASVGWSLIWLAMIWNDTSAITTLRMTPAGASINYAEHTTFYLYGLAN